MSIRYLKIALVVFVGLSGLLFVAGNVANWSEGLDLVGYVLGMEGHEIYPTHIVPPVTSPALVTLAYLIILMGESLVGALCLKGAWDLWTARNESADVFNALNEGKVVGGTSWLWARDEAVEKLDYLFVDEAGQMSLSNVLSISLI